MEHLGQSKTLLSERIAQQKLAEQVEAERWTRELHDSVRSELIKLVKGELDTTVSDMKAATAPLRSAMRQSRREALLLRRFSGIWWKACLIGACLSLGLGFGSWGLLSWLGSEIQQRITTLMLLVALARPDRIARRMPGDQGGGGQRQHGHDAEAPAPAGPLPERVGQRHADDGGHRQASIMKLTARARRSGSTPSAAAKRNDCTTAA